MATLVPMPKCPFCNMPINGYSKKFKTMSFECGSWFQVTDETKSLRKEHHRSKACQTIEALRKTQQPPAPNPKNSQDYPTKGLQRFA